MIDVTSKVDWNDKAVVAQVMARVDQELGQMGMFIVGKMQGYAPVRTGLLRSSIADQVDTATHTLIVSMGVFYSIYQEFGTRFVRPHPFARPAIIDAASIWHFSSVTFVLHPAAQRSEPLIASASGFRLPRRQKLTAKQVAHVRQHLIPTSKGLAHRMRKGGTKFAVRRFD